MSTFKMRAEGICDVGQALLRLHALRVEIVGDPEFPDVVVTIERPMIRGIELDLASLRAILAEVEDGHVMVQTLAPIAEYTGVRTYGERVAGKA